MKPKRQEKIRLNLDLSPQVDQRLRQLQDRSGAASLTEVIRRSLAMYDLFLEHTEHGGKVVFRDAKGADETIRLI